MKRGEQRKDFRDMATESLARKVIELKEELMKLNFRHTSGQLDNSAALLNTRRSAARAQTILSQRSSEV